MKLGQLQSQTAGPRIGLWNRRNVLINPNTLLTPAQRAGNALVLAGGINIVGQIAGTAQTSENRAAGFILIPPVSRSSPDDKLDNLQVTYANITGRDAAFELFRTIRGAVARGQDPCPALRELRLDFWGQASRTNESAILTRLADSVGEILGEIPCR